MRRGKSGHRSTEHERGEYVKTQRHMGEDSHVKTDTETGVTLSQTKEHLGLPEPGRVKEGSFSEPLVRAQPYQCLLFKHLSSKTVR